MTAMKTAASPSAVDTTHLDTVNPLHNAPVTGSRWYRAFVTLFCCTTRYSTPSLDRANFFSICFYWWMNPVLIAGHTHTLQQEEVPYLPRDDISSVISGKFQTILNRLYRFEEQRSLSTAVEIPTENTTKPATTYNSDTAKPSTSQPTEPSTLPVAPSLYKAIYYLIGLKFLFAIFLQLIAETLAFAGPLLTQRITNFLQHPEEPEWHGWLYVALLFVLPFIATICRNQYTFLAMEVGARVRSALVTAVFRKALVLSPAARRLMSDGEVINVMSVDCQKLMETW